VTQPRSRSAAASGRGRPPGGEVVLDGLGVSPGVAIGPAHRHEAGEVPVPEHAVPAAGIDDELARFRAAVDAALRQIAKLKQRGARLPAAAGEEIGFLLDAHAQMLSGSRLVRGVEARIATARTNAEAAVQQETSSIAKAFAAMDDSYLAARVADVRDVGGRLLRNLTRTTFRAFSDLAEGTVVVAEDITPADTALMDPERIAAFACVAGGMEGHTAIMARSLGLPAVLGAAGLMEVAAPGDMVVVDGSAGRVVVRPEPATLAAYEEKRAAFLRAERQLRRLARLPAVTRDGIPVALHANLELPRDADLAMQHGAAGIGLLRSEFMFMNRDDLPGEDEQYAALARAVTALGGRPATIRTLDAGGEKLPAALRATVAPGPNPALGLRAIRLALREPVLLETQLAAILRAAVHGPVRILLPMISHLHEIQQVRAVLARVERRLLRRGVALAEPRPPLGVMIEVPGAALAADSLARACDFFAIGTNDLTMYTLAIDRGDEQVAHLYTPLHPAVLRLIQFTTEAALRNRIPVSLCGEMAGDPRYTALLLGLGIRELSMAPIKIARIKNRVRGIDLAAAALRAQAIMGQSDPGRIAALLDDFNALA
jgi:phosphotransferase system enzyme I (PtsI)